MKRRRWGIGLLVVVATLGNAVAGVAAGSVVINELAWGGTAAGSQDEWIELYNATESLLDLTGWEIQIGETRIPLWETGDGTLEVRRAVVEAGGYFLLERTDDETVSDIDADLLYKGSLANTGANVQLLNASGEVVDQVLCADSGWLAGCGGDGETPYASMERQEPDSGVWATWSGAEACGLDASGEPLCGTPRGLNSATVAYRSAPRVEFLAPEAVEVTHRVLVQWVATDPDGEPAGLRVRIEVAVGSEEWSVVVENLANGGSYLWDASPLAGVEDVRLRITAFDASGLSGGAMSAPFKVQASP
jgi:hypothetical protein